MHRLQKSLLTFGAASSMLASSVGCGRDDRDPFATGLTPTVGSETGASDSDDSGGSGESEAGENSSGGAEDGGLPPDVGPGDDTGANSTGSSDDGGPPDDGTLPDLPWSCEGFQPNYPDEIPYATAKELCSWINNCRMAYSFHSRYPCGGQEVYPGEVTPDATWPMKMAWDSDAAAAAQAEADALAAGGTPNGRLRDSPLDMCAQGGDYRLWIDAIDDQANTVSDPYTVTARDKASDWSNRCSALGKGFAFFRLALAYVDGCGAPIMSRFGCGLAQAPDGANWAVVTFVP